MSHPTPDSPARQGRSPGMAFILAIVFLDMAGVGLAVPVVPKLVAGFVGGDLSKAAIHVGTMSAIYTAMMFLCAPFLGALSDRFGRKPVMLASLAATAAAGFWTGFADSLAALFAARALAGLGGASVTVAQTYIADVSTPEDRAKNFGMVGAAFGVGFIVGPAIGGLLGAYGPHVPFLVGGAVALLNLLYGAFVVPESHGVQNRRAFSWKEANPLGWVVVLKRHAEVRGFSMALLWVWIGQQALFNTWVLYTTFRFGWTTTDNGMSLAMVGITSVIVQGFLVGKLLPMLGERRAILGGFVLGGLVLIGYGLATQGWMMYALIAVGSLGGVAGPTLQGKVSQMVGPSEQGAVQGALTSLNSVTGIVGPFLVNSLFSYVTAPHTPVPMPGLPFLFGGACMIVGAFVAARFLGRTASVPAPEAAAV